MMNKKISKSFRLSITFSLVFFLTFAITMFIGGGIFLTLVKFNVIQVHQSITYPIALFIISCIVVGTLFGTIFSRGPLKPINGLMKGLDELSKGHFEKRINLGSHPLDRELSNSFNKLAEELENTEVLRSDFVNNFSHEFKTPIVSISGFSRLLLDEQLSDEKRSEYLTIINNESKRLSDLATRVLDLTKVENQIILTDITIFNLSEQIRYSILLLEDKWSKKNLNLNLTFNEYMIEGNEELLKQVWINLIDNAIKFIHVGGKLTIDIQEIDDEYNISICNNGPKIEEKDVKRIFDNFYQADISHNTQGMGIGLSVVNKIIKLHRGLIEVKSDDNYTTFTIKLHKYLN